MTKAAKTIAERMFKLSPAEREELLVLLWEGMQQNDTGLSDEESRLIDSRLAAHRANPNQTIPWSKVRAELQALVRK
ncbi:MAG: addiction module protein [Planctomycetes bacterium]|nr:addiction module protein [Planctomycetota bacterium]